MEQNYFRQLREFVCKIKDDSMQSTEGESCSVDKAGLSANGSLALRMVKEGHAYFTSLRDDLKNSKSNAGSKNMSRDQNECKNKDNSENNCMANTDTNELETSSPKHSKRSAGESDDPRDQKKMKQSQEVDEENKKSSSDSDDSNSNDENEKKLSSNSDDSSSDDE